ncbi:MAG: Ig-like domain-containing protein [Thermoanaerobaculia bacterium]|nr:Ig-like domain-containing protein [Thermoanaerobaculia bacterium]
MISRLTVHALVALLLTSILQPGSGKAAPIVVGEVVTTDADTPVMIDVLANDQDPEGIPMFVEVSPHDCPGDVENFGDGTLVFTPGGTISTPTSCQIGYEVNGVPAVVQVSIEEGGGGGGGEPDPEYFGVDPDYFPGCLKIDPDTGQELPIYDGDSIVECCMHELNKATVGHPKLPYSQVILDENGDTVYSMFDPDAPNKASENHAVLCRGADYAYDGNPAAKSWFETYFSVQDGPFNGSTEFGFMGSEVFSPLYGSWIAGVVQVIRAKAEAFGHSQLEIDARSWLKAYWAFNALAADRRAVGTSATVMRHPGSQNNLVTHDFSYEFFDWDGLVVGLVGPRRLGNTAWGLDPSFPLGSVVGLMQPRNQALALAVDSHPRNLVWDQMAERDGKLAVFYEQIRLAYLLSGRDYFAANGGTVNLDAFEPPASVFGLTEGERDMLRDFVMNPGGDQTLFYTIVNDFIGDRMPKCEISILRTSQGLISWFDGTVNNKQPVCNYLTPPFFAGRLELDGHSTFLSTGGGTNQSTMDRHNDASWSTSNQVCAVTHLGNPTVAYEDCIDRPGGESVFELSWNKANGLEVVHFGGAPTQAVATDNSFFVPVAGPSPIPFSDLTADDSPSNGVAIDCSGTTQPPAEHGTITCGATEFTFDPASGFYTAGSTTFDYKIALIDDPSVMDTATVTLQASGEAPILAGTDPVNVPFDASSVTIPFDDLLDNDLPDGGVQMTGEFTHLASNLGSLSVVGSSFVFTPGPDFLTMGSASFTYEIELISNPSFTDDGTVNLALGYVDAGQIPFESGPRTIPGMLEIEHYDDVIATAHQSGEGEAYHDTTPTNLNTDLYPYRESEAVDAFSYNDGPQAPVFINYVEAGEWLEYTVDVDAAGTYAFSMRYATHAGEGDSQIQVIPAAGTPLTVTLPASEGVMTWSPVQTLDLSAGLQILKIAALDDNSYWDRFELSESAQGPYLGNTHAIPGDIEVEHFDDGAPGDAYFDTTPENLAANPLRPETWVDAHEVSSGLGWVGYIEPGEWLEYTAEVEAGGGDYEFRVRYSTTDAGGDGDVTVRVFDDAGQLEAAATVTLPDNRPPTGGAGPFDEVIGSDPLSLSGGSKLVRLEMASSSYNLGKFRIIDPPGDPDEPPTADNEVVYARPGEDTEIPVSFLLDGDHPEGGVIMEINPVVWPDSTTGTIIPPADPMAPGAVYYFRAYSNFAQPTHWEYRIRKVGAPSLTANGRVDVIPALDQPVANPDRYSMPANGVLTINSHELLRNDSGTNIRLDGLELLPERGDLVQSAHLLIYTPESTFTEGTDTFTYWIRDGAGTRSLEPGLVTITVDPNLGIPIANPDTFVMAAESIDATLVQLILGPEDIVENDVAANGGALRIGSWAPPDPPNSGTVVQSAGVLPGFVVTPIPGFQGTLSWTYAVVEANVAESESTTIDVAVVPAPVAHPDSFSTPHNTSITFDPLIYMLGNDESYGLDIQVLEGSVTTPQKGTLDTSDPEAWVYTPYEGETGQDTFSYQAANELIIGLVGYSNWDVTSDPTTVSITIEAADVATEDDSLLLRNPTALQEIPWTDLFRNDLPPDELVLISYTATSLGHLQQVGDTFRYTPGEGFWSVGSDSFTYTVQRAGGNPNVSATATVTLEAEPVCALLAEDRFEADLSTFEQVVQNGGTATIESSAALEGASGLLIDLPPGSQNVYVSDHPFDEETHFVLEFLFDSSELQGVDLDRIPIVETGAFSLWWRSRDGGHEVRLFSTTDDSSLASTPWTPVAAVVHRLRLEWRGGTGPGADDGYARLWIDGVRVGSLPSLDNDQVRPDKVRLGAPWHIDPATQGSLAFDAYRVCRGGDSREFYVVDDFEDGTLDAWTGSPQSGGGTVAVSSSAALEGNQGLEVSVDGNPSVAYVHDKSVGRETHHWATFLLDASGLLLGNDENFFLMGGNEPGIWSYHLRIFGTATGKKLKLYVSKDSGWVASPLVDLPDGQVAVGIEWWAASYPGADDGGGRLVLDHEEVAVLAGVDNDQRYVERASVGAIAQVDSGTVGTFYVDDFESWSAERSRMHDLVDDFESGNSAAWQWVTGSASVVATSAIGGAFGLEIGFSEGTTDPAHLGHVMAGPADHLHWEFDLDPSDLNLGTGVAQVIFAALGDGSTATLNMRWTGSEYELKVYTYGDGGTQLQTDWMPLDNTAGAGGAAVPWNLHVEWWAASYPGASDGGIQVNINGSEAGKLTGLDNDQMWIDRYFVGAVWGVQSATSGNLDMDNFEAWQ